MDHLFLCAHSFTTSFAIDNFLPWSSYAFQACNNTNYRGEAKPPKSKRANSSVGAVRGQEHVKACRIDKSAQCSVRQSETWRIQYIWSAVRWIAALIIHVTWRDQSCASPKRFLPRYITIKTICFFSSSTWFMLPGQLEGTVQDSKAKRQERLKSRFRDRGGYVF